MRRDGVDNLGHDCYDENIGIGMIKAIGTTHYRDASG